MRRNHPEDYADYIQCCDIASFDIYPAGSFSDTFIPCGVHLYRIVSRWPGDTDGDGKVDLDDFTVLKQNFGIDTRP
ncbi:MAG: hypothetical protein GX591_04055 [Planctomycetes bacterium]|nr:hypothetical protein [Planctomycetota bacterium]